MCGMGCSASINMFPTLQLGDSLAAADRKALHRQTADHRKFIKLLILGAAESGKSTVLKQIRILHTNGYTEEELREKKYIIYLNVFECLFAILENMEPLGIQFHDSKLGSIAKQLQENVNFYSGIRSISEELRDQVKRLWHDAGVQACYNRRNEYQLYDCTKYFLDAVDRVADAQYMPTVDDILQCRLQTTGVVDLRFTVNRMNFLVIDVGGQRSERRKWIHQFDDVRAVIFVAAISEYDQVCAEDGKTNRIHEALNLFDNICNNQFFKKCSMILFLNKKDLFEDKLGRGVPLQLAFPSFKGVQTYENAISFIKREFVKFNQNSNRQIYSHETCATDTNQVQLILQSVLDMIIRFAMTGAGLN